MHEGGRPYVLCAGVVLFTLVAWLGVLSGSFHYDDYANIIRDPATSESVVFYSRLEAGFRPLLRASYYLDHYLWGFHAPGFLATNLLLHLVMVVAIFVIARGRLGGDIPAAVAALVFAVQPAHAEVIAYVSGRSSGLAATLLLLALLCYERTARWRIAAFILWIGAILTKETALVFPALLVVWEITRPEPLPGALKRLAPFLFAGFVLASVVLALPRMKELIDFSFALRSPLESLAWNAIAVPETLSLWFRPWALSIEHPVPEWNTLRAVVGGALLLGLGVLALLYRRRFPHLALAILFPLVALLPTHSIIAKLDPVTEKPLYLAWLAVALLAGALAKRAGQNPVAIAAFSVALVSGAIFSAQRVEIWQNPVKLWTEAVSTAPQSARAWNNLGVARLEAGNLAGAEAALTQALVLDPRNLDAFETRLTIRLLQETNKPLQAVEPQ
jgi:hypothetical protein